MATKTWALVDMAGIGDLAKRYRVSRSTICNWRTRYASTFPDPLVTLSGGPVFSFRQVAEWHRNFQAGQAY